MNFFDRSMAFFSSHVTLNAIAHSLGGFGLAVILQNYIEGSAFVSAMVGWLFIAISAGIHVWSMYGK